MMWVGADHMIRFEKRVYLDYAATTPVHPSVAAAMEPYWRGTFGNASSLHETGRIAKAGLEEARDILGSALNTAPETVIFTSGGTEADNLAVIGGAWARRKKGNHIITTAVEHHAILHAVEFLKRQGFTITLVPVDGSGIVDPDWIRRAITPQTTLISVMHANNEVGTIQPIEAIGAIAREHGIPFHVDAVQSFTHLPIDMAALPVDMVSVSAHKIYGPKGAGALVVRPGARITPTHYGGEQENQRRAGTENTAAIVGLGAAVALAQADAHRRDGLIGALADRLAEGLLAAVPGSRRLGHPTQRLRHIVNLHFPGVESEILLVQMDLHGLEASSGSACAAGSTEPSHVLQALGLDLIQAQECVRFSLGDGLTETDIDRVIAAVPALMANIRGSRTDLRAARV